MQNTIAALIVRCGLSGNSMVPAHLLKGLCSMSVHCSHVVHSFLTGFSYRTFKYSQYSSSAIGVNTE